MPHEQGKAAGHAGGEKHLPLIKMQRFALSRRAGPRPDKQICKRLGATVLQGRFFAPSSSLLALDTSRSRAALLLRAPPSSTALGCGETSAIPPEEHGQPLPPASCISLLGIAGGDETDPSCRGSRGNLQPLPQLEGLAGGRALSRRVSTKIGH